MGWAELLKLQFGDMKGILLEFGIGPQNCPFLFSAGANWQGLVSNTACCILTVGHSIKKDRIKGGVE